MKARVVAFSSIIKQLNRSCILTTQAYNAADIRQNQDWSATQASMKGMNMMTLSEITERNWATQRKATMMREMVENKTEKVSANQGLLVAQEAARKAVELMKVEVAQLTDIEYKKLAAEKYGEETTYTGTKEENAAIQAELEAKKVELQWRSAWKNYQVAQEAKALKE